MLSLRSSARSLGAHPFVSPQIESVLRGEATLPTDNTSAKEMYALYVEEARWARSNFVTLREERGGN